MNTSSKLYSRVSERHYSAHHALLEAASRQLEITSKQQPGWFYNALIAITFSALALEALSNAVGDRLIADWKDDFESCSPAAKTRLLTDKLGIAFEKKNEPWHTINWLGKFRNQIAHPKPEMLRTEEVIGQAKHSLLETDAPESRLEREVTLVNAKRAVAAVRELKAKFCEKIPIEQLEGIATDGWSSLTEPKHGA
jgi:hypothetical protein